MVEEMNLLSSGMPTEESVDEDVSKPCMRHNDSRRFKPPIESDGPLTLADPRALKDPFQMTPSRTDVRALRPKDMSRRVGSRFGPDDHERIPGLQDHLMRIA